MCRHIISSELKLVLNRTTQFYCMVAKLIVFENGVPVVNEEFCHLISIAGGQVGKEGGAAGGC